MCALVTGVQTCALPIFPGRVPLRTTATSGHPSPARVSRLPTLRFRKGRFYRRHHASCDGIEVRQNDRGSVVGGEIGMMTAKAADQERANSTDITLRSVRHQPGKRLAIGLFRLNHSVQVEE